MIVKNYKDKPYLGITEEAYDLLSNNAIIVFLAFTKVSPNINPVDKYMCKKSNMCLKTYKRYKKELIDNDLLYLQRTGAKGATIIYHFGKRAVINIREKLAKKRT